MNTQIKIPTQQNRLQERGQLHHYKTLFPKFLIPDEVLNFATQWDCFWLINRINCLQHHVQIAQCPQLELMQFWRLDIAHDQTAFLACNWDKNKMVYEERIGYASLPFTQLSIWAQKTWTSTEEWYWLLSLPIGFSG